MAELARDQESFAERLAADTGLDVNVVRAWTAAEQGWGGSSADYYLNAKRENPSSFHSAYENWLNVGVVGGDPIRDPAAEPTRAHPNFWQGSPTAAADRTAAWMAGKWNGGAAGEGASDPIRRILATAGQPPATQMDAITGSGWAASAYGGGLATYGAAMQNPKQQPKKGGGGLSWNPITDVTRAAGAAGDAASSAVGSVTGAVGDAASSAAGAIGGAVAQAGVYLLLIGAGLFLAIAGIRAMQGAQVSEQLGGAGGAASLAKSIPME